MMLGAAEFDLMEYLSAHLADHPWDGCTVHIGSMPVTWMSSAIAGMIIVALGLIAIVIPVSRRRKDTPTGVYNVLEILTVFVRDSIARPALGDDKKVYKFLPLLLTLFVFVLGMSLIGLAPLGPLSAWLKWHIPFLKGRPIGATPTAVLTVCAALAMITCFSILFSGLHHAAHAHHKKKKTPMLLCWALSPVLWAVSLCPPIPGFMGVVMLGPLVFLELIGVVAKCFALMIRLFANMIAGHAMLAVLMMFVLKGVQAMVDKGLNDVFYITPAVVVGSAAIGILEMAVALLQAFLFTVLTAVFLGLYAEPAH
ncbi:MAG: F0F1 ATP synthase subunit A [Phycisphaerales bacterium]|jgi:F-type H+-transporting ATPase subunit a|nr:F0F1 ATP synthase subunit A [Phycisphaerales bacterium]